MNTVQTWQTVSTGLDETLKMGTVMGRKLRGGEVIELSSDLGGGKTSFVKGLAEGIGSLDNVRSPSFTLHNQYHAEGLTLHHFDFYRLFEPGEMRDELAEVLRDPQAVVIVEWGHIIKDVLPDEHLTIRIKATGHQSREFVFSYPSDLEYILPRNT